MGALGLCNVTSKKGASSFPHPPISLAVFLTLEEALRVAWDRIHNQPRPEFDPATALEVGFTAELHEVLLDELLGEECVPGFTREIFSSIERPEVKNFNGKKVAKRPDLLARLAGRSNVRNSQDGIFVECKLVDETNESKRLYCDKGITRFTDGDYAWAMTEAMMVAYSRDHRNPGVALVEPFIKRAGVVNAIGKIVNCDEPTGNPRVAISKHRRDFPLRNGKKAPPITLRHLWLPRPKAA